MSFVAIFIYGSEPIKHIRTTLLSRQKNSNTLDHEEPKDQLQTRRIIETDNEETSNIINKKGFILLDPLYGRSESEKGDEEIYDRHPFPSKIPRSKKGHK